MIHKLDTREQLSPEILKDQIDYTLKELEVGDYQTYREEEDIVNTHNYGSQYVDEVYQDKIGHCVEIKIGTDVLDKPRMRDEFYRMRLWQMKNPYMGLHAIWVDTAKKYYRTTKAAIWKEFVSLCSEYYIWPHRRQTNEGLITFLKKLDQPKAYQRDTVYMKRTDEPTTLARMFRQIKGVSSEMAMIISKMESQSDLNIKGLVKKNMDHTKLWEKIDASLDEIYTFIETKWSMETGDEP